MGLSDILKKNRSKTLSEGEVIAVKEEKEQLKPSKEYFFISCRKSADKQKLYDLIQVLLKYDTPTKISSHEYKNGGRLRYFPKRLEEAFDVEMASVRHHAGYHRDEAGGRVLRARFLDFFK